MGRIMFFDKTIDGMKMQTVENTDVYVGLVLDNGHMEFKPMSP
jgi:hypothetical protein